MTSVLLQIAAPYILGLQGILSFFLLIRGHNLPGGGFIAGLLMAAAFIMYSIAFDVKSAKKILKIDSEDLLVTGLLMALASGMVSMALSLPFMTGLWLGVYEVPVLGKLAVGTPFLFDIGVYCVVVGMTLLVAFRFLEENEKDFAKKP